MNIKLIHTAILSINKKDITTVMSFFILKYVRLAANGMSHALVNKEVLKSYFRKSSIVVLSTSGYRFVSHAGGVAVEVQKITIIVVLLTTIR